MLLTQLGRRGVSDVKGEGGPGRVTVQRRAWRAERDGAGEAREARNGSRLCPIQPSPLPSHPHPSAPATPASLLNLPYIRHILPAGFHPCCVLCPGHPSSAGTRSPVQVSILTSHCRVASLTPGLCFHSPASPYFHAACVHLSTFEATYHRAERLRPLPSHRLCSKRSMLVQWMELFSFILLIAKHLFGTNCMQSSHFGAGALPCLVASLSHWPIGAWASACQAASG